MSDAEILFGRESRALQQPRFLTTTEPWTISAGSTRTCFSSSARMIYSGPRIIWIRARMCTTPQTRMGQWTWRSWSTVIMWSLPLGHSRGGRVTWAGEKWCISMASRSPTLSLATQQCELIIIHRPGYQCKTMPESVKCFFVIKIFLCVCLCLHVCGCACGCFSFSLFLSIILPLSALLNLPQKSFFLSETISSFQLP